MTVERRELAAGLLLAGLRNVAAEQGRSLAPLIEPAVADLVDLGFTEAEARAQLRELAQ